MEDSSSRSSSPNVPTHLLHRLKLDRAVFVSQLGHIYMSLPT